MDRQNLETLKDWMAQHLSLKNITKRFLTDDELDRVYKAVPNVRTLKIFQFSANNKKVKFFWAPDFIKAGPAITILRDVRCGPYLGLQPPTSADAASYDKAVSKTIADAKKDGNITVFGYRNFYPNAKNIADIAFDCLPEGLVMINNKQTITEEIKQPYYGSSKESEVRPKRSERDTNKKDYISEAEISAFMLWFLKLAEKKNAADWMAENMATANSCR